MKHSLCSTATDVDWEQLYALTVTGYPGFKGYPPISDAEKAEINAYQCGDAPAGSS